MKKTILLLVLVVSVFAGITTLTSCNSTTKNKKTETNKTKTDVEAVGETAYQCPMKCEGEKTYDKPGNCPECGMKIKKNHVKHDNHNHKHDGQ